MDGMTASRQPALDLGRGERLPCAGFLSESASAALVGRVQAARGWPVAAAEGGLAAAATALSSGRTPEILLLDLDGTADPLAALEALADLCEPGTRVVAVGSANDVALFRTLLAAGVGDYLTKPLTEPVLAEALERSVARPAATAASKPADKGRVVAVVGARGGVGASSLAANLAAHCADSRGRRTVLVDLDLQFGTAALSFDVEPGRGLLDALANPDRVDELFLQRAAVRLSDRLSILCAEEAPDSRLPGHRDGTAQVLERLRAGFGMLVLDLPRWAVGDLPTAGEADQVVVVTDYTLGGLRDAVRLTRHFRAAHPGAGLLVAGGQVGHPGRAELKRADVEKALGAPVAVEIPFEPKLFNQAGRDGTPLVRAKPRAGSSAAVQRLASLLFPEEGRPVPLWRRLTGRGR